VPDKKLAVGSWQLAVGSWQLAVGSWQLAVGSNFKKILHFTVTAFTYNLILTTDNCQLPTMF